MAKKMWSKTTDRAIEMYRTGDYVYLYGAKNVRLTSEAQIRGYFNREKVYFSRYTEEELNQIIRNSISHMADDCSGFVGECTGDKQYSIGQINNCSKYNTLQAGPTASILFTTWGGTGRHIGLDVGGGLAMHMGYESTDKNIREGKAGIIFEPISARAWERSGESNCVDYKDAYSPYEPTTRLWNELHPNPKPVPVEGWVGEAYGKELVPVYWHASGATPLAEYPALAAGNLFEVTGESANRWHIRIASIYVGWLDKQYCLRKTPEREGKVTSDLWLRTSPNPNINSNKITIMPHGAEVQICDTKPSVDGVPWYYVYYNDKVYGFCSSRYIK